ncbi:hypothetical protein [Endozoicomonas ascidiicola]|uniref:hypothetical protein n=1 Tax=Endozoicomonas ascidiicola TaxID=1698521 RepID=UPI000831D13A|nr:hypothetical protein [Endozoicomonas ascidiicola]
MKLVWIPNTFSVVRQLLIYALLVCPMLVHSDQSDALETPNNSDEPSPLFYSDGSANGYQYRGWWAAGLSAISVGALFSDDFSRSEKRHFGLAVLTGATSQTRLRKYGVFDNSRWARVLLATSLGVVPGLIDDLAHKQFNKDDLAAEALGSLVGAVVSDLLQGPVDDGPQYGVAIGLGKVGLVFNYDF